MTDQITFDTLYYFRRVHDRIDDKYPDMTAGRRKSKRDRIISKAITSTLRDMVDEYIDSTRMMNDLHNNPINVEFMVGGGDQYITIRFDASSDHSNVYDIYAQERQLFNEFCLTDYKEGFREAALAKMTV